MRLLALLVVALVVSCTQTISAACAQSCSKIYARLHECSLISPAVSEQDSFDECAGQLNGFSVDECNATTANVGTEPCDQLAASWCPATPADQRGPGCVSGG